MIKFDLYHKFDNKEYDENGKRLVSNEKVGDSIICINSSNPKQRLIEEGEIYKIRQLGENWVIVDENYGTAYMLNRFMLVDEYRELLLNNIIKD